MMTETPHERDAPWLDYGRILVADLVARRRADRDSSDVGGDADGPSDDPARDDAVAAGDALIAEVRSDFHRSLSTPTPFTTLVASAHLTMIDAEVLAATVAVELDDTLARLVGYANGIDGPTRLTVGNVMQLVDDDGRRTDTHPARHALMPTAPLVSAGFISLVDDTSGRFASQQIRVHSAVVWASLGDRIDEPDLPTDRQYLDIERPDTGGDEGAPRLTFVSGAGRVERRGTAISRCLGSRFVATPPPDTDHGWRALVRDATITSRSIILELDDALDPDGRRWIERAVHLEWAVTSRRELAIDDVPHRPHVDIAIESREPTDEQWAAALGPDTPRTHRLDHDQLDAVSRIMPSVGHDIDAAVRRLVGGKMDTLAQRIRPTRGWDDIVLSPERTELLRSIVDRYRFADTVYDTWGFDAQPSRGLVAAFSGPSGTGKTLSTEIIAGGLGLDVFKLDLSSVVSKYIGETERNLEEIFDAAGAGNMVLFFDEADALFGKRSEVKDARDRYANIEVSYLLQRLERYDGLVILATNFEKNIDEAFLRRIHVRVEFAIPEAPEREAIWKRNLPATAPIDGVDSAWLAERFEISGGAIRNAAIHAAFLAAAAHSSITMEHAVMGVAREFRKVGRLIKREAFGDFFDMVAPDRVGENGAT